MCDNFLVVAKQYFDSARGDNKLDTELEACKLVIVYLIPFLEARLEKCETNNMIKFYDLWENCYAFAARRSFEHFIDYMEMDLDIKNKVLGNRRAVLKPLVYYLNKSVYDDKLRYINASFPPSYGKSYTLNMFSAWCFGLDRNNSILRLSYSEELVLGFSRMIQAVITNPRFGNVFPDYKRFGTKQFAKEKESDWVLKDSGMQKSHIARTREGSTTGERANRAIIFDDMTKGASEATDSSLHQRLYNKWKTEWYNRKTGDKVIFIFAGTMWSPEDILNRVAEDIEKTTQMLPSKKWKNWVKEAADGTAVFIRVPLLDAKEECTCLHVMSTKEARILKETTDEFLFACVYQQDPIPPSGLNFAYDMLNHYEELPLDENTGEELCSPYCYAVLDTTRKGKDNASMPIFKYDGESYYMIDVVFEAKAMSELYATIIAKIEEYNITWLVVENNTDTSLKTLLEERLKAKGINTCVITEKYQAMNKERRIKEAQGLIRKLLKFKDKKRYTPKSNYGRFMENLTRYSFDYPNRHDDAPDSLALFVNEIILERGKPSKPVAVNRAKLGF